MLQIPSDTVTQMTQVYNGAIFIHFGADMANIFPWLMQVIIIKCCIFKLLKTLCFCTSSLEINQWNVHCFTPVHLISYNSPHKRFQLPQFAKYHSWCMMLQVRAIGVLNSRISVRAVVRAPNVNASTISCFRPRFEEFDMTANCRHAQRPFVTMPVQDH